MGLSEPLKERIEQLIQSDKVVLFMKGTRRFPQCGFSNSVVQILDGMLDSYKTVNVLEDPQIRDGIKEYSSWPTIPQLYIAGEFVGGADIVREMLQNGELAQKLGVGGPAPAKAPKISVTEGARNAFTDASGEAGPLELLRFEVSPRFEYGLFFGAKQPDDFEVEVGGGMKILVDKASAKRADGVVIDFVEGPGGAGFKIENPNEPARVKPLSAKQLKEMLDRGEPFELLDVRSEKERGIAKIAAAKHLEQTLLPEIEALPKDTTLVFHCHHGVRSRSAAEHFLSLGFTRVYNLDGGIDAWSISVDPSVARY
jgi:monothiol glutaredoxin